MCLRLIILLILLSRSRGQHFPLSIECIVLFSNMHKKRSLLGRLRNIVAHLLSVISDFLKEKKKEFHARSGHWDQPSTQGLLTVKFCFCKGIHRRDCTPKKTWHAGFYWHTGDCYRLCNILSGRYPMPMELTGFYRRSFPGPPRYIFVLYARDPVMVTKEEKTNRSIGVSRLVTRHWRRYWRGMLQRWVNYWYEGLFFFYKYGYILTYKRFLAPST